MTYTQLRVTRDDERASSQVFVPSWAVCGLKQGDRVRLQTPDRPFSTAIWTVVGFGRTDWNTTGVQPTYLPVPVPPGECPVWG